MSAPHVPTAYQLVHNAIGDIGLYQWWLIFWTHLHRMPVIWHQLMMLLSQPPPKFTCSDPSLDKCDPNCPSHVFDTSDFKETIITKWDMVCTKKHYSSIIQSIVMAGILAGNVIFGYLADRFGRKIPLVGAVILQLVSGVIASFSPDMYTYTFFRFLSTTATGGTMMTAFAILMEFTAAKYRALIGILFALPFHVAHVLIGFVGYFFRSWNESQLIFSMFSAIMILYWWVLPESPRWLITMGRVEDTIKTLEYAAKFNKRPTENIRSDVEAHINENAEDIKKQGGHLTDLFKTSRMRCKTLVLFFVWFLVALDFYAVAQYIGQIDGGNVFLNITNAGLIQIPGTLLCALLNSKFGRKPTLIASCVIISGSMFTMMFLPTRPVWPNSLCSCIAMMGAAMCFTLIYVYSAEIYPTTLRVTGLGYSSMCARFGSMTSPHFMRLKETARWLPPVIFASVPLFIIVVTFFFLPETNGKPLPDTVEDADDII